jgi:hypothetical protein
MLKVAIIGCGNIAGGYDEGGKKGDFYSHIKSYRSNKDVDVVAVFDPNITALRKFSKYWNVKRSYTDLSVMLTETAPELVSICSPNQFHCEQIKICADAGVKTILCEKPLAYHSTQAEEVMAYCESRNVRLVINYLRSWDEKFIGLEKTLNKIKPNQLEAIHVNYNKGVFHNASHFIVFFKKCFGELKNVTVIRKERTADDSYADFLLSFEKCDKVYFFNHRKADILITEIDIFFKHQRLRVLSGGQLFETQDYKTGKKTSRCSDGHKTCKTRLQQQKFVKQLYTHNLWQHWQ